MGPMHTMDCLYQKKTFCDELDRQRIPFYLLAHVGHDYHVLIRGLTVDVVGMFNPECNKFRLDDSVLKLVEGLDRQHVRHVFAKNWLEGLIPQ